MQKKLNKDSSSGKKSQHNDDKKKHKRSEIREAQENSSILDDEKSNTEMPYPKKTDKDTMYKSQEEFIHKKPNLEE